MTREQEIEAVARAMRAAFYKRRGRDVEMWDTAGPDHKAMWRDDAADFLDALSPIRAADVAEARRAALEAAAQEAAPDGKQHRNATWGRIEAAVRIRALSPIRAALAPAPKEKG